MVINIPKTESNIIQEILKFLDPSENHQVWIVGGMIRDIIKGKKECFDIDLALSFNPFKYAREFARFTNSGIVILDEERHIVRIVRTIENNHIYTLDLSEFRAKNIDEDLKARDFTINALSAPLFGKGIDLIKNNKIDVYDPLNGLQDLNSNKIRACSNNIFNDDPLRILRAFRFAALYESNIQNDLLDLIKKHNKMISNVSGERIRDELFKIFTVSNSYCWIRKMDETHILDFILPELSVCHEVTQNDWHHLDVFNHSLLSLEKLETLLHLSPPYKWWSEFIKYLNEPISGTRSYKQVLKFGCLLHDIGKIPCKEIDINTGKISFHRHEVEGAKMMKLISERLRLSSKELNFLQNIVKNHMRPGIILQQGISDKRLYRYYSECGRDGVSICLLCLADRFSALGDNITEQELSEFSAGIYQLMNEFYIQLQKPKIKPFLNGNEIMKIFDLKPGPVIKTLLDLIEESQYAEEIKNKEEAIALIRKELPLINK